MIKFCSNSKIIPLTILLFLVGISSYVYMQQFHPSKIALARTLKVESTQPLLPEAIKSLFNQPFDYLGEGNQAYAFTSADGKYVVKFFKSAPLTSKSWLEPLSGISFIDSYLKKNSLRSQRKFDRVFNAYEIAYCHDQENCGLNYVHLNQTDILNLYLDAVNAIGVHHSIFVDDYAFVVQQMGIPLHKLLKKDIKEGNIDSVKQKLHQVIGMYLNEYQKGIFDNDHNLMVNVGFAEGRPIRIDVGKLVLAPSYSDKAIYQPDLEKIIHHRLAKWLKRHAPEYADEILLSLEPYLQR